jgi:hypothetical protein
LEGLKLIERSGRIAWWEAVEYSVVRKLVVVKAGASGCQVKLSAGAK